VWAALIARIADGLGRLPGPLPPALYRVAPAGVHRVDTDGEHDAADGSWQPGTGLGAPDGSALLAALASPAAPVDDDERHPRRPVTCPAPRHPSAEPQRADSSDGRDRRRDRTARG
jgi:hypothetical protein